MRLAVPVMLLAASVAPRVASAQSGAPKVAVIVVDDDTFAAGRLQSSIERRLVGIPQIRLRTADQSVSLLYPGSEPPPAASDPLGGSSDALSRAGRAFFEDKLADAAATLASIDGDARSSTTTTLRLLLWRAAIAQAKNEPAAATYARQAIAIAPDIEVDLRIYPPSLEDLVKQQRPRNARTASIQIIGLPPGATARFDDHPLEGRVPATPGKHWLVVAGRGYRPLEKQIDVNGDTSLEVGLPLLLPDEARGALSAMMAGGAASPAVAALASKLEVDALVVVGRDRRGMLGAHAWSRTDAIASATSPGFPDTAAGEASLEDWIEAKLEPEPPPPVRMRNWTRAVRGGLTSGLLVRSLDAAGSPGFSAAFFGAGPELDVSASPGRWRVDADASFVEYGFGGVRAAFPDGSSATVHGGSTARLFASAGFAFGAGPSGREIKPEVAPVLALSVEHHASSDLSDERGDLGFFPSSDRASAIAALRLGAPLAGSARVEALAGVVPFSWLHEARHATGRAPSARVGVLGSASLRWEPGRWNAALSAYAEERQTRFSGTAIAPLVPSLHDALVGETIAGVTFSFGREF